MRSKCSGARLLRLAILTLAGILLPLAAPTVWAQLAPQPDAPPSEGVLNPPQPRQELQPQSEPQPPSQPQLQIESQPPSSGAQHQPTRPQPEPNAPQESPSTPPPAPSSQAIPTLRVSVNLVDLFFVAHDKAGKLVPNLTRTDCNVFEDDKQQKLKSFAAQSDLPLSIGILLDTSVSQQRVLPDEQKAAAAFLRRILRPTDEAFLISFDVTVDLLADWTSNPDDLKRALDAAQINSSSGNYANGTIPSITKPKGTLLYDAVYLASNDKLRQESGRKAMVLLTDGQDEGSEEKLQSAIEAAQKADAVVYVLLISDPGFYGMIDFSSDGAMRKLVEATGGEVFPIGKNGKKLPAAFDTIESQLRTEYQVTYTPSNAAQDGGYRRIRVACRQNGQPLKVQARQGYYALTH
ncbi:MAG: VWA domain-containing protein [Acidobacteriaceae bacterium]